MFPLIALSAPADDYFLAVKNDNEKAVVTLLFRGLDVNTVDSDGRHGLQVALMEGALKVAKTLLDLSSTKVDIRSKNDETPLMIAALKGHAAIAKQLIKRGADVNKTGWTPLHYASSSGHLEVIKLLIDEHAYIDTQSPNQSTPLMLAAMYGTDAAVKLLVQEGADVTVKNELGLTAADFAAKAERTDLAKYLDKLAKEGVNPKTDEKSASFGSENTSEKLTLQKNMTRQTLGAPSQAAKSELAPNGKLFAAINFGNPILAGKAQLTNEPVGVSVDLARELASRLGVALQLVTFEAAGKVVEAMKSGTLDVGFFAIDPARAVDITFTNAYIVIEGAYLVKQNSPIQRNEEVDRSGIRIAVGAGSAYDLYLSREIKQATLVRAPTSPAVVDTFLAQKLDVAAGVKQQLQADAKRLPGLRLLDGRFMVINQAMGTPAGRPAGAAYLREFVEEMKATGFIAQSLAKHKIEGAAVAPLSP